MTSREKIMLGSLVALFLLGLRALVVTGLPAAGRDRGDVVARLAETTAYRSDARPSSANMSPLESLAAIDVALAREDILAADRAWRVANDAVMRNASWHAFAALGDAALRIGERSGQRDAYVARARDAYFAALMRARAERSIDGVTRVWRAFVALGDHEVAEQCAIIAEKLQGLRIDAATIGAPEGAWTTRVDP